MYHDSNPKLNRRDFLKLSGAFFGALMFKGAVSSKYPIVSDPILIRVVDNDHLITSQEIEKNIRPNLETLVEIQDAAFPFGFPILSERTQAHQICISDLIELIKACNADKEDGVKSLYVASAFRDYHTQKILFNTRDKDEYLVAPPGTSQHHLGTAFDFTSISINKQVGIYSGFAYTLEGKWLSKRAWEYGFLQSYVNAHDNRHPEPWHYLYVGRPIAKYFQERKEQGWPGDIFDLQIELQGYYYPKGYSSPVTSYKNNYRT
jgi:LAS superfamily LD-carboxypeptidase LdcB